MNRRSLLKLLSVGVVGYTLDIDKLLWVPGQKTIFLPSRIKHISTSEIIAAEMQRILPQMRDLFNRDDTFYTLLNNKKSSIVSDRSMRIPLVIKPGSTWDD